MLPTATHKPHVKSMELGTLIFSQLNVKSMGAIELTCNFHQTKIDLQGRSGGTHSSVSCSGTLRPTM